MTLVILGVLLQCHRQDKINVCLVQFPVNSCKVNNITIVAPSFYFAVHTVDLC